MEIVQICPFKTHHPPKVKIMKTQYLQDHHFLPKLKLYKKNNSPYKTTTSSKGDNCCKSVLSGPTHPPKVEIINKNSSFKTVTFSQNGNYPKSVLQDHYILPRWKLLKINSFKTITPSQSKYSPQSLFSRPSHPPKIEIIQNQSFQDHHTPPK